MNDFSVGDFAQQLLNQDGEDKPVPTSPPAPPTFNFLHEEKAIDISKVEIPENFLEVITEDKNLELPAKNKTLTEDKAEVAEDNPVAGQAIDIIIEGLGKMLDTIKETLNEVKEFVNEHSLVNEISTAGGLGVNMAPTKNNKKKVAVDDEEDDGKKDRVKHILAQVRGKKRVSK